MIALLGPLAFAGRPAPLPPALPPVAWTAPTADRRALSSGLPVFVVRDAEVPLFEVRLLLRLGEDADPEGLEGLCAITFDLLDEGAGDRDAATFAAALKALGATLSTSCAGDSAQVVLSGLSRNLAPSLDLLADVIRRPRLAEADLAIARDRHRQDVAVRLQRPDGVADRAQDQLQYGAAYVGRSPTDASLAAVTIGQVHGFWSKRVGPAVAAVVAGGDVDPDGLVGALEARLGDWRPAVADAPREVAPRADTAGTLYVVDLPGAPQSAVRAWAAIGRATDPDRFALDVATEAFGGAFGNRLNLNLREDKGWTYNARCESVYREGPGLFACATLVRADATADALAELRRELADVGRERPIAEAEADRFRRSLLQAWPLRHETTASHLDDLGRIWLRGLPTDWTDRWRAGIGATTASDVARAAAAAADPARTTFLVVGDLASTRAALEALGLPLVELRLQ